MENRYQTASKSVSKISNGYHHSTAARILIKSRKGGIEPDFYYGGAVPDDRHSSTSIPLFHSIKATTNNASISLKASTEMKASLPGKSSSLLTRQKFEQLYSGGSNKQHRTQGAKEWKPVHLAAGKNDSGVASYERSLKNETGKSGLSKALNQRGVVMCDEEPDMVDSRPAQGNLLDKSLN